MNLLRFAFVIIKNFHRSHFGSSTTIHEVNQCMHCAHEMTSEISELAKEYAIMFRVADSLDDLTDPSNLIKFTQNIIKKKQLTDSLDDLTDPSNPIKFTQNIKKKQLADKLSSMIDIIRANKMNTENEFRDLEFKMFLTCSEIEKTKASLEYRRRSCIDKNSDETEFEKMNELKCEHEFILLQEKIKAKNAELEENKKNAEILSMLASAMLEVK